jgi:stearoyl-CoA desaturase (Delta-9 desaturase)
MGPSMAISFLSRRFKPSITVGAVFFFIIHALAVAAFFVKPTLLALVLCAGLFLVRKFGITGGFHRYFSHRSFKTSRLGQFALAFLGGSAAQKGALWWAAHHRHHHQHSDEPEDVHSVKQHGFYWAHVGWILSNEYHDYDQTRVKDLTRFPELVWLDKFHFVPPITLAALCALAGGWAGFLWGFCLSTVILYHTTFAINSLCHLFGRKRFETGESSKNSWLLALVTLGEGWHNNHHRYPHSTRQGFRWWEIDMTYYVLRVMQFMHLIHGIKEPPCELKSGSVAT